QHPRWLNQKNLRIHRALVEPWDAPGDFFSPAAHPPSHRVEPTGDHAVINRRAIHLVEPLADPGHHGGTSLRAAAGQPAEEAGLRSGALPTSLQSCAWAKLMFTTSKSASAISSSAASTRFASIAPPSETEYR